MYYLTCGSCNSTFEVDITQAPKHMGRKNMRMNRRTPTLVTDARARIGSITTDGGTMEERGGGKGVCGGGWERG